MKTSQNKFVLTCYRNAIKNANTPIGHNIAFWRNTLGIYLTKFSCCSVSVKCYLFKKYCSTLYCAPMWFDCTKTALKK